jgi:hypothetical protein
MHLAKEFNSWNLLAAAKYLCWIMIK